MRSQGAQVGLFDRSREYRLTVERFLDVLTARGYRRTPCVPVTDADSSVTFVNATVTPLKDRMRAGEPIGLTCQFQHCVRAHGAFPLLLTFGMVGAVGDREHLARICPDVVAGLRCALGPGLDARLAVLCNSLDTDLIDAVAATGAPVTVLPDPMIGTRWEYGDGYPLTGRGVTLLYRNDRPACRAGCRIDCDCGRWQQLGNIIAVDTPKRNYVEVGIGVEALLATSHGDGYYGVPEIAAWVNRWVADGWALEDARHAVNVCRALGRMFADGTRPGPRGSGHVLRGMLARLGELHAANRPGEDLAGWLARFGANSELLAAVDAEERRRNETMPRRISQAQALLRRRPKTSAAQLRATFGLGEADVKQLLGGVDGQRAARGGGFGQRVISVR